MRYDGCITRHPIDELYGYMDEWPVEGLLASEPADVAGFAAMDGFIERFLM